MSHADNDWGILIFTTSKFLHVLRQSSAIYLDGTFRTTPLPYAQFVTVHGLLNGYIIPLAFCLLTGKTVGQYRQVLQHLKREVRRTTRRALRPKRVVLDFEASLLTAVETEFPHARISACYFHFNQSLWRHVQELGLAAEYRRNRRLKTSVRMIMAIGFLPLALVRLNFQTYRGTRRIRRLIRRLPAFGDWLDYVEQTYVSRTARFPPAVWNVYDRDIDTRTNNHVEGTYARLTDQAIKPYHC